MNHDSICAHFLCLQPFPLRDPGSALQICFAWLRSTVLAGKANICSSVYPSFKAPASPCFAPWGEGHFKMETPWMKKKCLSSKQPALCARLSLLVLAHVSSGDSDRRRKWIESVLKAVQHWISVERWPLVQQASLTYKFIIFFEC